MFVFILSTCDLTLSDLCMDDDSLGFEDCHFATHLLNLCVFCANFSVNQFTNTKFTSHVSKMRSLATSKATFPTLWKHGKNLR